MEALWGDLGKQLIQQDATQARVFKVKFSWLEVFVFVHVETICRLFPFSKSYLRPVHDSLSARGLSARLIAPTRLTH